MEISFVLIIWRDLANKKSLYWLLMNRGANKTALFIYLGFWEGILPLLLGLGIVGVFSLNYSSLISMYLFVPMLSINFSIFLFVISKQLRSIENYVLGYHKALNNDIFADDKFDQDSELKKDFCYQIIEACLPLANRIEYSQFCPFSLSTAVHQ